LREESPTDSYQLDLHYMSKIERMLVQDIDELNPQLAFGYQELMDRLMALSSNLALYFNEVMVKDPDPAIRANRLAYLNVLRQTFLRVADFSQWQ
ncbi:MAG TPA: hypothetical protein VFM16_04880, partial [Holophagaceae bacterium]|nr:hypothetical protein [Holophagaceae bacterium]